MSDRDRAKQRTARGSDGSVAGARLVFALSFLRREPIIPIFVVAGIFQILSGDPLGHALFLFGAAAVLAWDRARSQPLSRRPSAPPRHAPVLAAAPPWAMGTAIIAYAWIAGGFARFTWPITVAVLLPGVAAIGLAWWESPPVRDAVPVDRAGAYAWMAVFVALGLWELTQLLLQPSLLVNSYAHPTLSYLTDPLLNNHHIDRSLLMAGWLFLGWDLIER